MAACFLPGGARAGGREAADFFFDARTDVEDLLRSTDAPVANIGASMGLDRTTELFSLSLELRSIDTVRFDVGVIFSEVKEIEIIDRAKKARFSYLCEWTMHDVSSA